MSVLGVRETCGHLIQYPIVDIYACIPLNTHDRSRVFFIVYIRIPSCEPPTFLPPYSKSSDCASHNEARIPKSQRPSILTMSCHYIENLLRISACASHAPIPPCTGSAQSHHKVTPCRKAAACN